MYRVGTGGSSPRVRRGLGNELRHPDGCSPGREGLQVQVEASHLCPSLPGEVAHAAPGISFSRDVNK